MSNTFRFKHNQFSQIFLELKFSENNSDKSWLLIIMHYVFLFCADKKGKKTKPKQKTLKKHSYSLGIKQLLYYDRRVVSEVPK